MGSVSEHPDQPSVSLDERLDALVDRKLEQTQEKIDAEVRLNGDDIGAVLLPEDFEFEPESNHPNGSFYGPKLHGKNFAKYLDEVPTYIDPNSTLAGKIWEPTFGRFQSSAIDEEAATYPPLHPEEYNVDVETVMAEEDDEQNPMVWPPDFEYDWTHIAPLIDRYDIVNPINGGMHMSPDIRIGLDLGWGGILDKIRRHREDNPDHEEYYDGLEYAVEGIQRHIERHADAAREKIPETDDPALRENLREMAAIQDRLVTEPPRTFREALQWAAWYKMFTRMHTGSGSLNPLDQVLWSYYERDRAEGRLSREEAIFHLACFFLKDSAYQQLGWLDDDGVLQSNELSKLMLEAVGKLCIPSNLIVCVGEEMSEDHEELFDRSVEIMLETKQALVRYHGRDNVVEGFTRNGYSEELAKERVQTGCHWSALPGREYPLNDVGKINFAKVLRVAFDEMMADPHAEPGVDELWTRFQKHLRIGIDAAAQAYRFKISHNQHVDPEIVLSLQCHGPIEQGLDASMGGVEFYNMCLDGMGLATVADSFGAIERRVEAEGRLTYEQLHAHLENDFEDAEDVQATLRNTPRFGSGDSAADRWAERVEETYTDLVKEQEKSEEFTIIPGIFSWVSHIDSGETTGATPNGRKAGEPLSQGANPDPGFEGMSDTTLSAAVARVQSGYGNTTPLQISVEAGPASDRENRKEALKALFRGHFADGGTLINPNVIDEEEILDAHENPEEYPDLVVRPTGFSVYFASLTEEYRQQIVDRILETR